MMDVFVLMLCILLHASHSFASWLSGRVNYLSSPTRANHFGVKIRHFSVPYYVPFQEDAHLECEYEIEGPALLYSLKWYKGDSQFYEYIPNKVQKHTIFPVRGLRRDQVRSSTEGSRIVLMEIGVDATDQYRCELVAEGPPFHTTVQQGNLTVVVLPEGEPNLKGSKDYYYLDDVIVLNCTPPISKPPATVRWYINNALESPQNVKIVSSHTNPVGLQTMTSQLNLQVRKAAFSHGRLIIRCEASLANLYKENVHIVVEEPSSNWFQSNNLYLTSSCSTVGRGLQYFLPTIALITLLL